MKVLCLGYCTFFNSVKLRIFYELMAHRQFKAKFIVITRVIDANR